MSKFQIIFIAIFIVCIIAGVALFATYKGENNSDTLPAITVWGTFPQSVISNLVTRINNTRPTSITVDYVEKTEANFNKDFIEALARGEGPDAILLPQDMLTRHEDKIIAIPYEALSERDFKNTYIPQAELYLTQAGSLAIPFSVDPLVMFWNRDLFTNAGIATYPVFWDEFGNLTKKIDVKDVNSNIRRSAIALGEFVNVNNAREILGALLMQAGNPVTRKIENRLISTLGSGDFNGTNSSTEAISFFTQFSDPRHPQYSWNRSLPNSKSWFLSGNLATYFGFSSELFDIREKNPNIDFDVAPLPQPRNGKVKTTYGMMYGFSIIKNTKDAALTYTVLSILASPTSLSMLNEISYLPPVRRDMIAQGSKDPYQTIFYNSALISRDWLDIDIAKTRAIFKKMIESVTSGREPIYSAIERAQEEMNFSIQNP